MVIPNPTALGTTNDQIIVELSGSNAWIIRRFVYEGKQWLGMSRWKRWSQDGEMHPSKGLMVEDKTFQDYILPALNKLYHNDLSA